MEKPFAALVIVMAMFVTIGALSAGSISTGTSQPKSTLPAAKPEHGTSNSPSNSPPHESSSQAATNHSANGATNSEIERGKYLVGT